MRFAIGGTAAVSLRPAPAFTDFLQEYLGPFFGDEAGAECAWTVE